MKTQALTALSLTSLLVLSTPTMANDWKGYAGSSCVPISDNADFTRTLGGAYRVNSGASFVQCPIVRDFAAGKVGRVLRARVRLTDRNSTDSGYCTFRSRNINGGTFDSQTVRWTGTGDKTITFGPIDASNWGSYMIRCRLP
ncbi:MAG: hypothetical protein R3240_04195, partial [Gammaproteobacteria bacterium]|nr:hypothetical protein [Gammaproteobacteria bacterium]